MPLYVFDSGLIIFVIPALLFALYAQNLVNTTFARYLQVPSRSRRTGAEVARQLLNDAGLEDVAVEKTSRPMGDHYDPRAKIIRLSPDVHDGYSVAALGVAAHETGHAVQHDTGYVPLAFRNVIVPAAQFGSQAAFPLFLIGFIFSMPGLVDFGIILFSVAVLFQIATLPVEFNASTRAVALLEAGRYIEGEEVAQTRKVLQAAAMTYVAAAAMALAQLMRLLLLRGRRR
jgi:uncharacterized protein